MPIDPSIIAGLRPAPIQNPLEAMTQIAQLQQVREQTEARRLAGEEARGKRTRQQQIDAAMQGAVKVDPATGRITLDKAQLVAHLPAGLAYEVQKQLDGDETTANALKTARLQLAKLQQAHLGSAAQTVIAAQGDPDIWKLELGGARGLDAIDDETYERLSAETDPQKILALAQSYVQRAGGKAPEDFTLSEGQTRFGPTGQVIAQVDKPEADKHSPAYVEWQDYRNAGGTLGFDEYMTRDANRKAVQVRLNTGQGSVEDVKDVVQGMIDGTLPPQLPGRASPMYNAIMAEAQRRGFNLAGAATDWMATQKHVQTMNGAQQLRLNQAVNALPEMLDNVERLGKQWNGGRFAILNRANLAAAKGGAYGTKAAAIATQLDAQIADVVADLGNVYMGGNSPTDHALQLAGKSLSADWSEPVLHSMVELAKKNVQIRRNSINSTGVAGASADNPYMPAPPPAAPTTTTPRTNPFR